MSSVTRVLSCLYKKTAWGASIEYIPLIITHLFRRILSVRAFYVTTLYGTWLV